MMKWQSSVIKLDQGSGTLTGILPGFRQKQTNQTPETGNADFLSDDNNKLYNTHGKFIISQRSFDFKKTFFPGASLADWNSWQWQIKHRITDYRTLCSMLDLAADEASILHCSGTKLPFSITPYYASLLNSQDCNQPLRKTVIPRCQELITGPEEVEDPLGEESDSPVEGIVHRYPDRVLFLTTNFCSTYCRYCTRSRIVGQKQESANYFKRWNDCLEYIEQHPGIRDVLLSGGDPLTLTDAQLEWLLARLQRIPHVEIKRIGTKVPVVLPQRITANLVKILKKYPPLYINIHFSHPDEITPETSEACKRLAEAGIVLGSQTVLLQDINDNTAVMTKLMQKLLQNRVRPYYIYQCDLVPGTGHFRTPVQKGLEIMKGLRGFTSGLAVPYFVIDAPHGGGKIPIIPGYIEKEENGTIFLHNYKGNIYHYPQG